MPAITSALAFLLFFWSHYLSGTADQLEIILFLVGLVCLALELFVFPGFGVFGMSGIMLMLSSIVMASHTFIWPTHDYEYREMGYTLLQVTGMLAAIGAGAAVLGRYFPSLPLFNRLVLKAGALDRRRAGGFAIATRLEGYESLTFLIGESGRTTSPLRPTGKARFGNVLDRRHRGGRLRRARFAGRGRRRAGHAGDRQGDGNLIMATVEQVREAMHRAPFLGFDIRLVHGRSYHVSHPDFLSVPQSPRGRNLMFHDATGRTHRIDLLLVVEIDEPPVHEQSESSANGPGE